MSTDALTVLVGFPDGNREVPAQYETTEDLEFAPDGKVQQVLGLRPVRQDGWIFLKIWGRQTQWCALSPEAAGELQTAIEQAIPSWYAIENEPIELTINGIPIRPPPSAE